MGIPFFVVFVLSIAFLSVGITGWGDFVSVEWPEQDLPDANTNMAAVTPYLGFQPSYWAILTGGNTNTDYFRLSFQPSYWAIGRCCIGFLLFLVCLYLMGFFLYLEERESGRIMKNVKSFAKLRQFLERHQKEDIPQ